MEKHFLLILFFISSAISSETNLDVLLEKVQKSKTSEEKLLFISQLKSQLAIKNKKAREESNAIIKAKKKLPSKIFKVE